MGRSILIIEDEILLARNIQEYLQMEGFCVHVCGDGETGLQMFDQVRPDIVILDYSLPDMNGLTVLQQLRGRDHQSKVVMVSSDGNPQTLTGAIAAGAVDYKTKPMPLPELCHSMKCLLP